MNKIFCWDGEDLCWKGYVRLGFKPDGSYRVILLGRVLTVQFFESQLFGFSDEAEYHAPGDKVESGIESD